MNIDPQQVHSIRIEFDAGNTVPPPYHYAYQLEIKPGEPDTPCSYAIQYLHREELSEDEILEEGFTLNDDWKWQGNLPQKWQEALLDLIKKQSWPKKPEKPKAETSLMLISLSNREGKVLFEGIPADPNLWEYFIQELIQAIYELAEKEAPFRLAYKEISSGNPGLEILIEASFAQRTISASRQEENDRKIKVHPDWRELKNMMKLVFLPDYDYDKASEQEPKKRGKYINTGEGLWFKFEEGLTEPDKKSQTLSRLEGMLKGLFE